MTSNIQPLFNKFTQLFYQGSYKEGLVLVNECLRIDSQNSVLYNNRALFHFHMNHQFQAYEDFQRALDCNNLNYMVYFNIFSLSVRANQLKQSLSSIHASLSSLYLVRARFTKSKQDIAKSLSLCYNNFDSLFLGILIDVKAKQFLSALDSISKYQKKNETNKQILDLIKGYLSKMNKDYSTNHQKQFYSMLRTNRIQKYHLKSDYQYDQKRNIQEIIHKRVKQFNRIYQQVDREAGKITHLVPKPQLFNESNKRLDLFKTQKLVERNQLIAVK